MGEGGEGRARVREAEEQNGASSGRERCGDAFPRLAGPEGGAEEAGRGWAAAAGGLGAAGKEGEVGVEGPEGPEAVAVAEKAQAGMGSEEAGAAEKAEVRVAREQEAGSAASEVPWAERAEMAGENLYFLRRSWA